MLPHILPVLAKEEANFLPKESFLPIFKRLPDYIKTLADEENGVTIPKDVIVQLIKVIPEVLKVFTQEENGDGTDIIIDLIKIVPDLFKILLPKEEQNLLGLPKPFPPHIVPHFPTFPRFE